MPAELTERWVLCFFRNWREFSSTSCETLIWRDLKSVAIAASAESNFAKKQVLLMTHLLLPVDDSTFLTHGFWKLRLVVRLRLICRCVTEFSYAAVFLACTISSKYQKPKSFDCCF